MDHQTGLPENVPPSILDVDHSTVDTSRPFRSVKEAVAIFGERFLAPEIHSPSPKTPIPLIKPETPIRKSTPNENQTLWKPMGSEQDPSQVVMTTVQKLEVELEETKRELKILKERGSETEVALASLNAELHKNMSKIAKAEAEVAGKAVAMRSSMTLRQVLNSSSGGGSGGEIGKGREKRYLNEKKVMKKKPVVPLVTDLFTRKNGKTKNSLLNPLYTSQMYWN